jgi:predicted ribosome quality control (RQC) complex YloA/Tae2 family protein
MLSLLELRRATAILEARLAGTHVERIIQSEDHSLVLTFAGAPRSEAGKRHVLLACSPEFARICILPAPPQAPPAPLSFAQYLKARLSRARFSAVAVLGDDRQAVINLRAAEGEFRLLLSILGPRSNIYLLDAAWILLYAMRPLEETRRDLVAGQPWINPGTRLKTAGTDRWSDVPDDRYLEEIERSFESLARAKEFGELYKRIANALQKEADALRRKDANMQDDLSEAIEAEEYRRKGELLKGVLHIVRPGANSVAATDYKTAESVSIPLDPRLSASANLELYFKRYQKEMRSVSLIGQQLDLLRRERGEIDSLRSELEQLAEPEEPDLRRIREWANHAKVRRLLARYSPSPRQTQKAPKKSAGKKTVSSRLMPKKYKTSDGLEIWVGRSDEGNDYLTTRLARGNDLFFHLEGFPGSHVVLRTDGRPDAPPESVLDACELAVHFSKLKDANRADVHIAPVKNVRKPSGARPGLVHVSRGKTIHLRRGPARLERILASRLDE